MRDILRTQSNMELFEKKVDFIQSLTIFAKTSVLGVSQGYEYASDNTKQKPGALPFISQKIRTAVSTDFIFTLLPCNETLLITNLIHVYFISN